MHLSHTNFYQSLHLFYISYLLGGNYAPDDFKRTSFRDDCDAGRQSTKGKSQSVFACLRSLVNLALPRIRQSDLQSIVYPSIATGSQRTFPSPRKRANDIATRRLLRGIRCSGSRVNRISLVIYSMRVGDVSPSFAVILAVPLPQRHSARRRGWSEG